MGQVQVDQALTVGAATDRACCRLAAPPPDDLKLAQHGEIKPRGQERTQPRAAEWAVIFVARIERRLGDVPQRAPKRGGDDLFCKGSYFHWHVDSKLVALMPL